MAIGSIFARVEALKRSLDNLTIDDLKRELEGRSDLLLLDIREIQETIDLGTIPGAKHVPRGMLEFWADPASPYYRDYFTPDKRVVVFCAGGGRSAFAAQALIDMGFTDVAHLEAGFNGWQKAGEPVQDVAETSRWMRKPKVDARPPMWIGHVALAVADVAASAEFFQRIGLRLVESAETFAIFELRGGTHLILLPTAGRETTGAQASTEAQAKATFDLMVDDLDATHASFVTLGLAPSDIEAGDIHRSFTITEPGGHVITVNSSHVTGQPV